MQILQMGWIVFSKPEPEHTHTQIVLHAVSSDAHRSMFSEVKLCVYSVTFAYVVALKTSVEWPNIKESWVYTA